MEEEAVKKAMGFIVMAMENEIGVKVFVKCPKPPTTQDAKEGRDDSCATSYTPEKQSSPSFPFQTYRTLFRLYSPRPTSLKPASVKSPPSFTPKIASSTSSRALPPSRKKHFGVGEEKAQTNPRFEGLFGVDSRSGEVGSEELFDVKARFRFQPVRGDETVVSKGAIEVCGSGRCVGAVEAANLVRNEGSFLFLYLTDSGSGDKYIFIRRI
ncbi:hypothetical protein V8G54_021309 [Vigna mungo]|uniref:Uncharacterized protein n=1 Tax=Vigna mungo TaxID=3915 RepID=A0AAQ3NFW3_VIGMU